MVNEWKEEQKEGEQQEPMEIQKCEKRRTFLEEG